LDGGGSLDANKKLDNNSIERISFNIYPHQLYDVGAWSLNQIEGEGVYADSKCDLNGIKTDTINSGTVEIIKFDTVNHIISGTFEFTVYNAACDTIKITEGRFDVNE